MAKKKTKSKATMEERFLKYLEELELHTYQDDWSIRDGYLLEQDYSLRNPIDLTLEWNREFISLTLITSLKQNFPCNDIFWSPVIEVRSVPTEGASVKKWKLVLQRLDLGEMIQNEAI